MRFTAEHLPLVAGFCEQYWQRPRDAAFYRWRYLDALPFTRMFLAVGDGRCLGMVCAIRKQYFVAGTRAECLEVFDWHSLPGLRGSGVGIRVMRAMMREGQRLISVGGTRDVQSTLPALRWQRVSTARLFELPTSGDFLAVGLERRLRVPPRIGRLPAAAAAGWYYAPRRRSVPAGGTVEVSRRLPDVERLYERAAEYQLLQAPSAQVLEWLTGRGPEAGEFRFLRFLVPGDTPIGWALTRAYDTPHGREGAIVEIFSTRRDRATLSWMVSEAACVLAAERPWMIRARASCPELQAALGANRFREAPMDVPVHTWPPVSESPVLAHITLNHGDEPIRPYPAR